MEKVISEFRVIETDDGFRIEIKGDKEKLRSFFSGASGPSSMPFGHRGGWRGWGMPGFPPGFRRGMGPWWRGWGFDPEPEEEGNKPKQA